MYEDNISEWKRNKDLDGRSEIDQSGFEYARHANDRAKNAEWGVSLLISEIIKLKDEIKILKQQ